MAQTKTKSTKKAPVFDEDKAMKEIKTFDDACKVLNISPTGLPNLFSIPVKHQNALLAHFKLIIIAEALNQGWQPNWNDTDEYKYFPWFEVAASKELPSGFGFSRTLYDYWYTRAHVGSRLCFRTANLARYAAKQFEDLYKEYFLIS